MGAGMSSITNCVLPNGHAPGAKRRKGSTRRKSTFLLKNSMSDSWDLETVQMISKISIFIKNENELANSSIFRKYSKFVKLYTDSDNSVISNPDLGGSTKSDSKSDKSSKSNTGKISDFLSSSENARERFKLHALIVDQNYSQNQELLDILERNATNHQFRTCLLVTPKNLSEIIHAENTKSSNETTNQNPSSTKTQVHPEPIGTSQPNLSKSLPLDFSIFDHVIMLNEGSGDQFCSSVLGFQLYQFLQNCQREAFARYALSLSNDYFLRLKSSDLTLLDTNNNKFSHLLGRKVQLPQAAINQLAETTNNCQAEQGVSTEIELDGKSYRCNLWSVDDGSSERDFIIRMQHINEESLPLAKHKTQKNNNTHNENTKSENVSVAGSDFNNNDRRNSESYSETHDSYLDRLSASHKSHHGGRRRSSLATLNTRNLKKNPAISKLLLKIHDFQHKYNSSEENHEMQDLLSNMSHFLQNEPDITSQKIAIQEKLEGEEHDLAKAMLNNNARNSISEKVEDPSRDTTTSSSTADTRRSSTFGATLAFRNKRNTTGFSPLRENGAFDETQENNSNTRNTCHSPYNGKKPPLTGHSASTPICKMANSASLTFTSDDQKTPFQTPDHDHSEINSSSQMYSENQEHPSEFSQLITKLPSIANTDLEKNKTEIEQVLECKLAGVTSWEFDAFKIENLSNFSTLEVVGMRLFREFNVIQVLETDECTALNWLRIIQTNYRRTNTYHNATHASDVMQATANFLTHSRCQKLLSPLDQAACLISAAVHDVDHRGKTNQFLCNSFDPLALLYNDKAVLENHHAATAFRLTLELDSKFNIFLNLEEGQFKELRAIVIEMVLATEMSQHFDIVNKFIACASQDEKWNDSSSESIDGSGSFSDKRGSVVSDVKKFESVCDRRKSTQRDPKQMAENQKLLVSLTRRMIIKVSDISNPVRPIKIGVKWTNRICEEYFLQTDDEKKANLPLVMPTFDRTVCNVPKSQIFFIDYFVRDMVDAWSDFINNDKMMKYLQDNQNFWRRLSDRDATTLDDLERVGEEEMEKCEFVNKKPEASGAKVESISR